LEFGNFTNFESGSLTMTSVIVVLPLGTLVAQRLATAPSTTAQTGSGNSRSSNKSGSKKGFLSSWSHRSGGLASQVTSRIQRSPPKEKPDHVDLELQRIINDDSNGIWVDRDIEQRSETRA